MTTRNNAPHELVERALELSRADGCVVLVDEETTANLRWAGNALTTNGVTRGRRVTVIATVDGAEGTASGVVAREAVGAADLEELVRAAEAAARDAGPAEDAQPLLSGEAASRTSPRRRPRPRSRSSTPSPPSWAPRSPVPGRWARRSTASPGTS